MAPETQTIESDTLETVISLTINSIKSTSQLLLDRFEDPPEELAPSVEQFLFASEDGHTSCSAAALVASRARLAAQAATDVEQDLRNGSDLAFCLLQIAHARALLDQATHYGLWLSTGETTVEALEALHASRRAPLKANGARHAPSRAKRRELWRWLDVNRRNHKSLAKAALAAYEAKVVTGVEYETVRDWGYQWNKQGET